jgi:rhodanese-related sulfurtransferase
MSSPSPAQHTVDREQLRAKLASGEAFKLVMAGSPWAFRAKHIPGSVHFDGPAQMLAALGKDEDIVLYCSNVDCNASLAAYHRLIEQGYTHVHHYRGGLLEWEAAGLPLEGTWAGGTKPGS